jgi:hypothetical protein
VTVTDAASGESITVRAREAGRPGHYVATLTLPAPGVWQLEIQPLGPEVYPASVFTPIQVIDPAAVAAESAGSGANSTVPWAVAAAVLLLGLTLSAAWLSQRRRPVAA